MKTLDTKALIRTEAERIRVALAGVVDNVGRLREAVTAMAARLESIGARVDARSGAENMLLGMLLPMGPLVLSAAGMLGKSGKKTRGRKKCASK